MKFTNKDIKDIVLCFGAGKPPSMHRIDTVMAVIDQEMANCKRRSRGRCGGARSKSALPSKLTPALFERLWVS